jgi:hypothetical protein
MKSQRYMRWVYSILILALSSCSSVNEGGITPNIELEITQFPSQASPQLPTSSPTTQVPSSLEWDSLHCEAVLDITWGSGVGEWGCSDDFCSHEMQITDNSDIYVGDVVNKKILKYSETSSTPNEIVIPEGYRDFDQFRFSVDPEHIFVRLDTKEFLIMTSEGKIESVLDMQVYNPSISSGPFSVDGFGGFFSVLMYLDGAGRKYQMMHYIDDDHIEIVDLNSSGYMLSLTMTIGRNSRIYSHDFTNLVYDWGLSSNPEFDDHQVSNRITTLSEYTDLNRYNLLLISVDKLGNFYFELTDPNIDGDRNMVGFIRFTENGKILNAGLLPDEWKKVLKFRWPGPAVAPDGSIYSTTDYNVIDHSTPPSLVRCTFSE